jgi:hypothetical protein
VCDIRKQLRSFLRGLLSLLRTLLYGWFPALMSLLRRWCAACKRRCKRRRRRGTSRARCLPVPPALYRRPDPLIYSQKYLKSLGLAVTYNNPDIQLYDQNGLPVSSKSLQPNTTYEIRARIWNNSTEAPAVHMPVKFSYMSFGVGQKLHYIGQTTVTVPVKGAFGHPTFAGVPWTTPAAGHYCLVVELIWDDDANPLNNVGQENTDVKKLNSPTARFEFPLRNDTGRAAVFRLRADNYRPPPPPPCGDRPKAPTAAMPPEEVAARRREALKRHGAALFPVPPGWSVEIRPAEVALAAEAEQLITVTVTAPADDFRGEETFNVNAFDDRGNLVGGVTLVVEG